MRPELKLNRFPFLCNAFKTRTFWARGAFFFIFFFLISHLVLPPSWALESRPVPVTIGVLAKRGQVHAQKKWAPTANYLSKAIVGYSFRIEPLTFDQVRNVAQSGSVDFLITNTAYYVDLEVDNGLSHIATMVNLLNDQPKYLFGGVIFTRVDRKDISTLQDLQGKSFAAVDPDSLGGFLMAWREMHRENINPDRDFHPLHFSGTHDEVVFDVLQGRADAGTVRTDTLERMAQEGQIDLTRLKIINDRSKEEGFPYLLSTHLYPEWPFATFKHTPVQLARDVSMALMAMSPESEAAQAAKVAGWTVPLDYQPVHDLLKELQLSLYEQHQGEISLVELFDQHGAELIAIIVLLVFLFVTLSRAMVLNRRLRHMATELGEHKSNLKGLVARRTFQLQEEVFQHQEALKRLEISEQRTSFFWNNIPSMNFIVDRSGTISELNDFAVIELGYQREELIGRPVVELFYEEDRPVVQEQFSHVLNNPGTVFEWELRKIHKDGKRVWVKETAMLTQNEEGPPVVLIVCRSIEGRMQAEDALRDAYDIINKSKVVAFLWENSQGWPVHFVSDNIVKLFGYSADEFKSGAVSYLDVIHADDVDRVGEEVTRYSNEEGCLNFVHAPYRIITKNQETKWIIDNTHIRRDSTGAITHYAGMVEDITEEMAKEEELRSYRAGLEEQVRERTSEIAERNRELERFNKLFVDREIRIKELKNRVEELELLVQQGHPAVREEHTQ